MHFAVQDPPLGTGDAVARARGAIGEGGGPVVVLAGDTPLLRPETLARLVDASAREEPRPRLPHLHAAGARRFRARRARRPAAAHRDRRSEERVGAPEADRRGQRRRLLLFGRGPRPGPREDPPQPGLGRVLPDRRRRDPRRGQGEGRSDRGRGLAGGLGREHAPRPRRGRGDGAPARRRTGARRGRDRARSRDRPHRAAGRPRAGRRAAPVRVARGPDGARGGLRESSPSRGLVDTTRRRETRSSGRTATPKARRSARARGSVPSPGCGRAPSSRRTSASATSSRPRTRSCARASRRCTWPTSATRTWGPDPTSAPASSPATTTGRRSTARRSGRAPSSAPTRSSSPP